MDFKDVAEGNCAASSTMYEISFDTFTRRVVCDKTTDPCGKAICQCDERKRFFINLRKISYFNILGHFVKKVKVWLTISPKQQHSSNWFSMKVWTLRILILNQIVSGMELQLMITMTSSAVENIQQGMTHIFEILLKPCFKNTISSSKQQQSLLWWFNN